MRETLDPNTQEEEELRQQVRELMNLVETLLGRLDEKDELIQRLRDEINRRVRRTGQTQDHSEQTSR